MGSKCKGSQQSVVTEIFVKNYLVSIASYRLLIYIYKYISMYIGNQSESNLKKTQVFRDKHLSTDSLKALLYLIIIYTNKYLI